VNFPHDSNETRGQRAVVSLHGIKDTTSAGAMGGGGEAYRDLCQTLVDTTLVS
jgi:hypothetical protein